MDPIKRAENVRRLFEQDCVRILEQKGHDYTAGLKEAGGDRDANANFKEVAKFLEGAPTDKYVVWAVYFLKQLFTIFTWLKDRRVRSEPLKMRIVDCINYLFILYTMLVEDGIEVNDVNDGPGPELTHASLWDETEVNDCKSALNALGGDQGKGEVK